MVQIHELRGKAAAEVCPPLITGRETLPAPVQELVTLLESQFGDHKLEVGKIYRQLGSNEDALRRAFGLAVGMPPHRYLKLIRLSVAARLLETTSLSVTQVSELVGYNSLKSFGTAFHKRFLLSPRSYRKRHSARQEPSPIFASDLGHQLNEKRLDSTQAKALMSYLRSNHPEVVEDIRSVGFAPRAKRSAKRPITNAELERLHAERLWENISSLPFDRQCKEVEIASLFTFSSPALFEFLREESLEVGRRHRDQGVAIAELAVVAAYAYEHPDLVTGTSTLLSRAWATLGNARRLAVSLDAAEQAFVQAEHLLPDNPDPRVAGKLLNLKALLHWYRQSYEDGLALADQSITLLEATDDVEALAAVLIDRAIVCRYVGKLDSGIATLRRALEVLPKLPSPDRLYLAAYYNLARYYRELGMYTEVRDVLKTLRTMSARSNLHVYEVYVDWLEGRLALDCQDVETAERLLLATRAGFLLAGATTRAGLVSLDLAIVYASEEKTNECAHIANEALAVLEIWRSHPHLERAWRTLKRAVITRTFRVADLVAVRDATDRFQDNPANERYVELSLAG